MTLEQLQFLQDLSEGRYFSNGKWHQLPLPAVGVHQEGCPLHRQGPYAGVSPISSFVASLQRKGWAWFLTCSGCKAGTAFYLWFEACAQHSTDQPLCNRRAIHQSCLVCLPLVLQAVLVPKDVNIQPSAAGSSQRCAACQTEGSGKQKASF